MKIGPLRRLLGLARRAAAERDPLVDDGQLLSRFAAHGDADAFELLVWRHGGMVSAVCRRILGDVHAAEDAFQATFLALARKAGSIRRQGSVAGWLHRVAWRISARARHAAACRQLHERRTAIDAACEPQPIQSDLRQVLDEELDRLPERFRQAVVLCYLEGRTTSEAAQRLGCPRGTVLSRLAAARDKLQVRLVRRGFAPTVGGLTAVLAAQESSAALIVPAVKAAVAGVATPRVLEMCEGVMRTMLISKIKVATALILTAGVLGGGVGWVTMSPGGPGLAIADPPAAKSAGGQTAPHGDNPPTARDRTEGLKKQFDDLERQWVDHEQKWLQERLPLRFELIAAEEKLKEQDREFSFQRTRDEARIVTAERQLSDIKTQLRQLKGDRGGDHPTVRVLAEQAEELDSRLQIEMKQAADRQQIHVARVVELRRSIAGAEERLQLSDRVAAARREHLQSHLQSRLAQLMREHGISAQADNGAIRLNEIDRKLDDLSRRLSDLRRDLGK